MSKSQRGFASMDPAKQRAIASLGGQAAQRNGTAHRWTRAEAIAAGKKGGRNSRGGQGKATAEELAEVQS